MASRTHALLTHVLALSSIFSSLSPVQQAAAEPTGRERTQANLQNSESDHICGDRWRGRKVLTHHIISRLNLTCISFLVLKISQKYNPTNQTILGLLELDISKPNKTKEIGLQVLRDHTSSKNVRKCLSATIYCLIAYINTHTKAHTIQLNCWREAREAKG